MGLCSARYNKLGKLILTYKLHTVPYVSFYYKEFQMSQPHPNEKDFSISITVHKNDIDELGHVNNVVYVRWVQEVAAAHWDSLASSEIKQKYVWVVLRHEIDYLSAAFEDDSITATTWVGESNGARSERFVQITNTKIRQAYRQSKNNLVHARWCYHETQSGWMKKLLNLLTGQG